MVADEIGQTDHFFIKAQSNGKVSCTDYLFIDHYFIRTDASWSLMMAAAAVRSISGKGGLGLLYV